METMTVHQYVNRQRAAEVSSFYIGLDLGQRQDFSAISVIEEPVWVPDEEAQFAYRAPATGWVAPDSFRPEHRAMLRASNWERGRPAHPPLSLRHLERIPLGTRYPQVVERVVALMRTPPLAGNSFLVVDASGVGTPVVDMFRAALAEVVEIVITGGTEVTFDPDGSRRYKVPKRDLVSSIQALLQASRLRIAAGMPEAQTLVNELLNFQLTITERMHDTYEGRQGSHDDLVLSVAMAVWYRTWMMSLVDRAFAQHAARTGEGVAGEWSPTPIR